MKLSKSFTTVTPLSKGLALFFFIVFPSLGFYLGIQYQKRIMLLPLQSESVISPVTLSLVSPSHGPLGTEVTVYGSGFTNKANDITFGPFGKYHLPNGKPENVVATADSPDGMTLKFTIPPSYGSGIRCDRLNHCMGIMGIRPHPGNYPVSVMNANGISNTVSFTLENFH